VACGARMPSAGERVATWDDRLESLSYEGTLVVARGAGMGSAREGL
jgi:hypothetical protein